MQQLPDAPLLNIQEEHVMVSDNIDDSTEGEEVVKESEL